MFAESPSEKAEYDPLLPWSTQDAIRQHAGEAKSCTAHCSIASRHWYFAHRDAMKIWFDRNILPYKGLCVISLLSTVIYISFFAITIGILRPRIEVEDPRWYTSNAWEAVNVIANIERYFNLSLFHLFAPLLAGAIKWLIGEEVEWILAVCQGPVAATVVTAYLVWECGYMRPAVMTYR